MTKFLAVVKREYVQRVRTKLFVIMTILGPVLYGLYGCPRNVDGHEDRRDARRSPGPDRRCEVIRASSRFADESGRTGPGGVQKELVDNVKANPKERMEKAGRSWTNNFSSKRSISREGR